LTLLTALTVEEEVVWIAKKMLVMVFLLKNQVRHNKGVGGKFRGIFYFPFTLE